MKNLQNLFVFKILRNVFTSTLGFMVVFSLFSTPASAKDTLREWEKLSEGSSLKSNNGCFSLRMQTDGNLVLYGKEGRAFWSTESAGKGGKEIVMQGDGNLVMYDSNHRPIWGINPGNVGSGGRLVVQNDGNAVVYIRDKVIWAVNPGRRNCDGTRIISFPVKGTRRDTVLSNRYMKTSITISKNGRIDGVTKTWSCSNSGFTGGVYVVIIDKNGNILNEPRQRRYGVNGRNILSGKCSKRTDAWNESISVNNLNNVDSILIGHDHTPKQRITKDDVMELIRIGAEIYKQSQTN